MADLTPLLLSKYLFFYPVQVLVVLTALALVFRAPLRSGWCWGVTAVGLGSFFLWPLVEPLGSADIYVFWVSGRDICDGIDPYRNVGCLYPPTGLPLFALLGLFAYPTALVLWTGFIVLGTCTLVLLAQRALSAGTRQGWELPPPALGVFTAALALSVSSRYGIGVGQLSLFVTLTLLLAVWARNADRSGLAGLALSAATIKAQTMLPFLLLFHRRRDRLAWATLVAGCVGLYLLASPPTAFFVRVRAMLANISLLSSPGHMNNYPQAVCLDMIAFNRALHFVGVQDRTTVQVAATVLVLALGAWVAWRVCGRGALAPAPACCLVALYSLLFMYHRLYDALILVVPLVYTAGRARTADGPARWWYSATACTLVAVLYLRVELLKELSAAVLTPGAVSWWVQALVLPHALWLLLSAVACFEAAERYASRPLRTVTSSGVSVMKRRLASAT